MKRIRFLVAILVSWLFLFYNVERLSAPIDITDVAYIFVPLVAALTILIPRLRKVPLWVLLTASIPVFLALKVWVKSGIWGLSLPLTVTEVCFIAVTTILARWVSNGINEFEQAVTHITIGHADRQPQLFTKGQAEMYRELKRARHYQRPLTLMAVGIEEDSLRIALDRMVQEAQRAMMKQYVLSDVARVLCDQLADYNIIAQQNSHFLVLLPEMAPDELSDLVNRLREIASERVGATLQVGTASFPGDAVTFDSLVERAVGEMQEKQERMPSLHYIDQRSIA